MAKKYIGKLLGISGTHGTGKTLSALVKAQAVKSTFPNKRVGIITEQASECPLPINKDATADSQLWIFTSQIRRELEMMQHYDLIVCDRTPIDIVAYTWTVGHHAMALGMMNIARLHMHHYQHILFRTADKNPFHFKDGLRDLDKKFRLDIEMEMRSLYRKLNLPPEKIQYV